MSVTTTVENDLMFGKFASQECELLETLNKDKIFWPSPMLQYTGLQIRMVHSGPSDKTRQIVSVFIGNAGTGLEWLGRKIETELQLPTKHTLVWRHSHSDVLNVWIHRDSEGLIGTRRLKDAVTNLSYAHLRREDNIVRFNSFNA